MLSSEEEVEKLKSEGFDFGSYGEMISNRISKGAIMFLIFSKRELAHMGYVCLSEEAKNNFEPPYKAAHGPEVAYAGGTITVPKYRGKGLMTYGYFKRSQFLLERGKTTLLNVVETNNIASQKVMAKLNARIYAKARYLKIFNKWRIWKERPLKASKARELLE